MILLTELSGRTETPLMISDSQGLWRYKFDGDEFFVDDQGVTFIWRGRVQISDVRGVVLGTTSYTETLNIGDCRTIAPSFFWDDANKTLYVHHANNENDYVLDRNAYAYLSSQAGFATGRFPGQRSYYPDLFFNPKILSIGGLRKSVDPLRLGLMSFPASDYEIGNADGSQDDFTDQQAFNSQVRYVLMQAGQDDINDGVLEFTGDTGGAVINDERLRVRLQEPREILRKNVCPSVFDTTTFPSLDPKFENKPIPVAYGDIRRGICVPIDSVGVETPDVATITFKLADSSLHAIGSVTALYDSNGDSVALGAISLPNCTVQYAKAANKEVDLSRFEWEGTGYVIDGDDDNGLDIIKDVIAEQGELAFTASTYDTTQWTSETADHPEPVGLSIQSEKDLVEEVIEPITVSLQGIVDILGDGRVTFRSRDPAAAISRIIEQHELLTQPILMKDSEDVVSSIVIEYAPSFVNRDDVLTAVYDDQEASVAAKYGVNRSRPISPVQTVLTVQSDALAVGAEIASTTSDPENLTDIVIPLGVNDQPLFDVIQIDVGRPQTVNYKVFEILDSGLAFRDNELRRAYRLRLLPDRVTITFEPIQDTGYIELQTTDFELLLMEG